MSATLQAHRDGSRVILGAVSLTAPQARRIARELNRQAKIVGTIFRGTATGAVLQTSSPK